MTRTSLLVLLFGSALGLFATPTSASLSLSLSVSSGPASLCSGSADNFWDFTVSASPGDTGPMFFTFYDIGVACSLEPDFPFWDSTNHLSGTTPSGISVTDDPLINNVTFSCGSTTGNCDTPAVNDIILKFATGSFAYSWQDYDAAGAVQSGSGTISAPGTSTAPEPATLALLAFGLAGLALMCRSRLH
jgi:hypothetical protein